MINIKVDKRVIDKLIEYIKLNELNISKEKLVLYIIEDFFKNK